MNSTTYQLIALILTPLSIIALFFGDIEYALYGLTGVLAFLAFSFFTNREDNNNNNNKEN